MVKNRIHQLSGMLLLSALCLSFACGGKGAAGIGQVATPTPAPNPTVTPTPTPTPTADPTATPTPTPSATGSIIVDHTCTNLPVVPNSAITAAKQNLKIAYGHTSHGSQIVSGMGALMDSNPLYSFGNAGANGSLDLRDFYGNFGGLNVADDLGAPNRTAWASATRTYLNAHHDVNVIVWSWCGQTDGTQAEIQHYLDLMNGLESDFPNVKFVYMTGHLNGSGSNGNLNLRNEQIRTYCRTNRKVLFDFADIESWDPSAQTNFMLLYASDTCAYTGGNWATKWIAAHPTDPLALLASQCSNCAHSEKLNCIQKSRAFWWLLARLSGWNGQ